MSRVLGVALLAILAVPGTRAAGASLVLAPESVSRALAIGQNSVTRERAFDAEWTVTNEAGERLSVMTPFHRLVLAARHAAFKGEPLKPNEPERLLKEQKDRLLFWVHLKGSREDFARFYTPRLIVLDADQRTLEPSFVQNERSAVRGDDGAYVARCLYGFPTRELTGTSRVGLVVRNGEQKDVSRFTIDLSGMR